MAHQNNGYTYQFYGVGKNKGPRRPNAPKGQKTPRKMYAFIRKDQYGTPMEHLVNNNYPEILRQINRKFSSPGEMEHTDADGALRGVWDRVHAKGTKGGAIRAFIDKNGGSMKHAKRALGRIHEISFGADPKSK